MYLTIHRLGPDKQMEISESLDVLEHLDLSKYRYWIDVETSDEDDFRKIAKYFSIHDLAIEDCFTRGHFPKVEEYPNYTFIMLRSLKSLPELEELEQLPEDEEHAEKLTSSVAIFLADNFIITHRMNEIAWLDALIRQIDQHNEMAFNLDGQEITLRIVEVLTARFYRGIGFFQDQLDAMEDHVIKDPLNFKIHDLLELKKNLNLLLSIMRDEKNVFALLTLDSSLIKNRRLKGYFKNIDDRANTIIQNIQRSLDALSSVRDAYFAMSNVRLGDIMRVLAVITTIAAPLNIIVGIYGMNFEAMPLLHNPFGFWFISLMLLLLVLMMIRFFRRKNWL